MFDILLKVHITKSDFEINYLNSLDLSEIDFYFNEELGYCVFRGNEFKIKQLLEFFDEKPNVDILTEYLPEMKVFGECKLLIPETKEELKEKKKQEVTKYRDFIRSQGFNFNGILLAVMDSDQGTIGDASQYLSKKPEGHTIMWKSESGWIPVEKELIDELIVIVGDYIETLYNINHQHHQNIDLLTTKNQIKNYDITTLWP